MSEQQEWVTGEVRFVDIGEEYTCRCGRVSTEANVTNTGTSMKAWCPDCQSYIKFVNKASLGVGSRKVSARDALRPSVRHRVMSADGFRCVACGAETNLHVDHLIPVIEGGSSEFENLVTLCEECNLGKGKFLSVRSAFLLMLKAARMREDEECQ